MEDGVLKRGKGEWDELDGSSGYYLGLVIGWAISAGMDWEGAAGMVLLLEENEHSTSIVVPHLDGRVKLHSVSA